MIKQRVARTNEGKSGGYRTILLYRRGTRAFFVYGFPKNERDNLREDEVKQLKRLAKETFALSDAQIDRLVENGTYQEVLPHD